MHELGIVMNVARTVGEIAEENEIKEVCSVVLEIGEVSGIMTEYFVDCWNYFKPRNPVLANSELVLETIPAITWCDDCKQTYETVKYGRTCPHCGSPKTWLLQGNEARIKEITVPED
ncbi:MAG: hydrogenase maturation nickel metallochaperone HypA [Mogibacterium sp.]|nr:hydrogenase maturation nickel metallochaperone HypA [Mogibacterium sp.]